jgi:hypothetical protein
MTVDRFAFQRECVERTEGAVLNVGCKEDPAHLKEFYSDRVTNLDIRDFNHDTFSNTGEKVSIPVDIIHDATDAPWPFEDDQFDLVVIGDLLEDLQDDGCQLVVLAEARRVAKHLCITTPEDTPERDWHHYTTVTEEKLKTWLDLTGWSHGDFRIVDYGFVPRGYFVFADRIEIPEHGMKSDGLPEQTPEVVEEVQD